MFILLSSNPGVGLTSDLADYRSEKDHTPVSPRPQGLSLLAGTEAVVL